MTDGLECAEVSIATAGCLREQGYVDPLPPFAVYVTRRDGVEISMQVLCIAHLRTLVETLAPDGSIITLFHGPDDDAADVQSLAAVLTGRIAVH